MRDLKKYIKEYETTIRKNHNSNTGAFYLQDYRQIMDMSGGDLWYLIDNSFRAAFMVGYKFAKREMRKKERKANVKSKNIICK